jgi:hypothetical protein
MNEKKNKNCIIIIAIPELVSQYLIFDFVQFSRTDCLQIQALFQGKMAYDFQYKQISIIYFHFYQLLFCCCNWILNFKKEFFDLWRGLHLSILQFKYLIQFIKSRLNLNHCIVYHLSNYHFAKIFLNLWKNLGKSTSYFCLIPIQCRFNVFRGYHHPLYHIVYQINWFIQKSAQFHPFLKIFIDLPPLIKRINRHCYSWPRTNYFEYLFPQSYLIYIFLLHF